MQKFILKSIVFVSPFIILYLILPCFYAIDQGDLFRTGYFQREDDYRVQFQRDFQKPLYYQAISSIDTCKKSNYSVLVIGDSFSEMDNISYANYLGENDSISVLFYDVRVKLLSDSPVEILYALVNGDFFDEFSIDYVVLESVERAFINRANRNLNNQVLVKDIVQVEKRQPKKLKKNVQLNNAIIKYFVAAVLRKYIEGSVFGVYCFKSTKPVFTSKHENDILVFFMDIKSLPLNSEFTEVSKLNDVLNHLSGLVDEKGSKLIVLPAPDKYTVYYDYIINKDKYPQPVFCDILKSLEKHYIYIKSDEILKNAVSSGITDVYFADDTHWSPVGAKLIAEAIRSAIKQQ